MGSKDTYTITSESGVTLAIVPADLVELYKKNVYPLLCDKDKPERILVDIIEHEAKRKINTDEDVEAVNEVCRKKGFIGVADYIVYRMNEYIRTTIPICRNCNYYMASINGYCSRVGASVEESCRACQYFSVD